MNLRERTLEIARQQFGVRETGANRGPQVDRYLASIGIRFAAPWCAAFVYWSIDQAAKAAGVENPFVRTGYCPTIADWARRKAVLHDHPQPGDVFLYYRGRARHTGFVTSVDGSRFRTLEGNTNLNGSPEGIGVFARSRPADARYRFVRWYELGQQGEQPKDSGALSGATWRLHMGGSLRWFLPVIDGHAYSPVRKWGEFLGFNVAWDDDAQDVLFNGREVDTTVALIDGVAYAPVRDLAEFSGLTVTAGPGRVVTVTT